MHINNLGMEGMDRGRNRFRGHTPKKKKRGVPRPHGKHAAWELLPQICVVSVNESVGNVIIRQDYIGIVYQGNVI
jgi:hypothetical protein